ncbi:MAG: hypothetical protein MJ009_07075 [Paludibacteraceae bacterium]|nr:hypothetical protein [Paludibacteraceae bacterium]
MNKRILIISCFVVCALISCEKNPGITNGSSSSTDTPADKEEKVLVKPAQADISKRVHLTFAVGSSGQKTTYDANNNDILWSAGDQLQMYSTQPLDGTYDHSLFNLSSKDSGGGMKYAMFEGDIVPGDHYFSFYPSIESSDSNVIFDTENCVVDNSDAIFEYSLLNTQFYRSGSFNTRALPTVAHTTDKDNFIFTHLCAILEIWVKTLSQPVQVNSITLSADNQELYPLCGKYRVEYSGGGEKWSVPEYIGNLDDEDFTIYMEDIDETIEPEEYTKFYFVIPATDLLDENDAITLTCLISSTEGTYLNIKSIPLNKLANKKILPGDHIGFKVDADFSKDWQTMVLVKEIIKDWPDIVPDPTEY